MTSDPKLEYLKNSPTAVITVRVYPVGEAGRVAVSVTVDGRAELTGPEAAEVLRKAADDVEKRDADLVI